MRIPFIIISITLAGVLLMGCASPAEVQNMVVNQNGLVVSTAAPSVKSGISIVQVNGGEDTNPLWTSEVSNTAFGEALRGSLEQSGLLSATSAKANHHLYATLSELDQDLFGFDLTVSSRVNYRMVDQTTKTTWFDESVNATYTATFGDAPIAIKRLRLANEGTIRQNIKQFIERLLLVPPPS